MVEMLHTVILFALSIRSTIPLAINPTKGHRTTVNATPKPGQSIGTQIATGIRANGTREMPEATN